MTELTKPWYIAHPDWLQDECRSMAAYEPRAELCFLPDGRAAWRLPFTVETDGWTLDCLALLVYDPRGFDVPFTFCAAVDQEPLRAKMLRPSFDQMQAWVARAGWDHLPQVWPLTGDRWLGLNWFRRGNNSYELCTAEVAAQRVIRWMTGIVHTMAVKGIDPNF